MLKNLFENIYAKSFWSTQHFHYIL